MQGYEAENSGMPGGRHAAAAASAPGRGRRAALRWAFPLTLPVMAGYVFLGITYGILMVRQGLPAWLPIVTAAVVYTGSMEFLLTSILVSSFNPASAFATAIMVGARHLFYGLSMLGKYSGTGWKKFYLIFTTSDETFAVNYSAEIPDDIDRGWFYFWVSLLDQCYWIAGAALGGFFGSLITFSTKGIDFVMTAMFVTIFMNQWMKDGDGLDGFFAQHVSEFVGIFGSLICLMIFGPDHFIIPTMAVILAALTLLRPKLDRPENENPAGGGSDCITGSDTNPAGGGSDCITGSDTNPAGGGPDCITAKDLAGHDAEQGGGV